MQKKLPRLALHVIVLIAFGSLVNFSTILRDFVADIHSQIIYLAFFFFFYGVRIQQITLG